MSIERSVFIMDSNGKSIQVEHSIGLCLLGCLNMESGNVKQAKSDFKNSLNHFISEYSLAIIKCRYEKRNLEKASATFKRLSKLGSIEAMFSLACMLYNGDGMAVDKKKAIKLLEKAANNGHATSNYQLASMYYMGVDVPQSQSKSNYFLAKAGIKDTSLEGFWEMVNTVDNISWHLSMESTLDDTKKTFQKNEWRTLVRVIQGLIYNNLSNNLAQSIINSESKKKIKKQKRKTEKKKFKKLVKKNKCQICYNNPQNCQLNPCNHYICRGCAELLENCPYCRRMILKRMNCKPHIDQ